MVNFIMFMMLFLENMYGIDFEDMIRSVFMMFDFEGIGIINEDRLRFLLMKFGDRQVQRIEIFFIVKVMLQVILFNGVDFSRCVFVE